MKTTPVLVLLALALVLPLAAHEKNAGGPNGGRLLAGVEPHAEFLLLPDRTVQIVFVGDDGKAIAPAGQEVTVTTGQRMSPTRLAFVRRGDVLVSDKPVPAGDNLPVVVQIKPAAGAEAVIARFNLNLATCGECTRAEYACICDH